MLHIPIRDRSTFYFLDQVLHELTTTTTKHHRGKASAVYASTSLWHDIQNIRALRKFRGDVERATSNLDLAADDSRTSRSGKPVYKVVFTGGPCGGKSSSLASVVDRLSSLGFRTYASPEIATVLIGAGARPTFPGWTPATLARFQEGIVKTSLAIEDALVAVALARDEPSVILLDRGISDGAAYVDAETWDGILKNCGLTVNDAMARYDCVVHLVTAALGAPEAYTVENNAARMETAEEAASLDEKTRLAWVAHPRHRVVDNSTAFDEKVWRVTQEVVEAVGLPTAAVHRRRYVVDEPAAARLIAALPDNCVTADVLRTYLKKSLKSALPSVTLRRVVGQADVKVYRVQTGSGAGRQVERLLTDREYETELYWHADHSVALVAKMVRTFSVDAEGSGGGGGGGGDDAGADNGEGTSLFCSLEVYSEPEAARGRCILNVSAHQAEGPIAGIPSLLRDLVTPEREVTDDPGLSEHKVATAAGPSPAQLSRLVRGSSPKTLHGLKLQ